MSINPREQYRVVPYGGDHGVSCWYDPEFAERAARRAIDAGSHCVQIIKITESLISEIKPDRPRTVKV